MADIGFEEGYKEITGSYDDLKDIALDSEGYFLIRIDKNTKDIEVAFCKNPNKIYLKIIGKKPQEIYNTVLKEKLTELPEHLAYLGKECQKAYDALKLCIDYVQDEELRYEDIKK